MPPMYPHHASAIETFLSHYKTKDEFIGILLAGSLAHGYAQNDSDIDIILIATESEFEKRSREQTLAFSIWDICDYEKGYIDCKVTSIDKIAEVANKGSDPARYAFKDARLLYSENNSIKPLIEKACQFPTEQQSTRRHRFACQLLAWNWYLTQAEQKQNTYLHHLACQKIALFAGRIILNENQLLYPYHKWFLEEVRRAKPQPEKFFATLNEFLQSPSSTLATQLTEAVFKQANLDEKKLDWPNQFMADSEHNWINHPPPIDDV